MWIVFVSDIQPGCLSSFWCQMSTLLLVHNTLLDFVRVIGYWWLVGPRGRVHHSTNPHWPGPIRLVLQLLHAQFSTCILGISGSDLHICSRFSHVQGNPQAWNHAYSHILCTERSWSLHGWLCYVMAAHLKSYFLQYSVVVALIWASDLLFSLGQDLVHEVDFQSVPCQLRTLFCPFSCCLAPGIYTV